MRVAVGVGVRVVGLGLYRARVTRAVHSSSLVLDRAGEGRRRRAGLVVALVASVLTAGLAGCGEGGVGAATEGRMAYAGMARDLVWVTQVDGFDVAVQSVGVSGDEGMAAAYVGRAGTFWLRTARLPGHPGAEPVEPCADLADGASATTCEVVHDDVRVLVEGDGVDAATLREAGAAARRARDGELGSLLAELPAPPPVERDDLPGGPDGEPVRRGDLPEGDRAPDNDPGVGG